MNKKLLIIIISLFGSIVFAKETENHSILIYGHNQLDGYDDNETDKTVEQILYSSFDIEAYKSNYLLPVTYDGVDHVGRKNIETKFQISFKKSIFDNLFGLDENIYMAYTQTSWWQTTAESSPFREINYEPKIFIDLPFSYMQSPLKLYSVGIVHESNGRLMESRSWNRAYVSAIFQYYGIFIEPEIWHRFSENEKVSLNDTHGDDNPDILDYLGHGQLEISYPYKKYVFSTTFKKESLQFDCTFSILGYKDLFGYLQYFKGYGESLIDYNEKVEKIGIGFAISN
ncbi:MAG: phospholipase A [Sulfurospirillum sp.]|nr:phospholipase A [Sulfurospirillum sp.]MBL0703192.1 phospholipase A [Sulfurospirillum sp.]